MVAELVIILEEAVVAEARRIQPMQNGGQLLRWEKFRSELYPVLPFSLDSTDLTWSKVV